ncbi:MAG: zf-HC2 domain-containing protein [Bryobacteraceae bacterium]
MNCERMREQIPQCLAGRLDTASRERLIEHLETCSACRADLAELNVVWRGLEAMPQPEPGRSMRSRFMETLEAYQEGYQEAQRRQTYTAGKWWRGWWPARPVWQAALAALLLIAGISAGRYLAAPRAESNPELASLKGQVESLRQLVALSLLQEQSPSSRLRGVTYSFQMSQPDQQVEQALLYAVNHDSNVNVRLSAVDALAKFAANPEIRRALVDSLPVQDSPLVQIALIDLLVQLNDTEALPTLHKLAADAQTDEAVRQRAAAAAQKLETPK